MITDPSVPNDVESGVSLIDVREGCAACGEGTEDTATREELTMGREEERDGETNAGCITGWQRRKAVALRATSASDKASHNSLGKGNDLRIFKYFAESGCDLLLEIMAEAQ